jgi:hypothetical protein
VLLGRSLNAAERQRSLFFYLFGGTMNRRTARTNADILEVLATWLEVVRESGESKSENMIAGSITMVVTPNSTSAKSYLDETNRRLYFLESECIALPAKLTSGAIDATATSNEDLAQGRETTTRDALIRIAICRGGTLHRHSVEDIQAMNRHSLETLRRRTVSTEYHGVPLVNKCLYHVSSSSPSFRLDNDTMDALHGLDLVTRLPGRSASYRIKLSPENKEGAILSRRIMELRELAKTDTEKKETEDRQAEATVQEYMNRCVPRIENQEAKISVPKNSKKTPTKAKAKRSASKSRRRNAR